MLARPHDPRACTALLCLLPRHAPRSLAEPADLPPSPWPCSACSRRPAPRRRVAILRPPRSPASGRVGCAHRGLALLASRGPAPAPLRPAGPAPLSLPDSLCLPRPAAVAGRCAAPPSAPQPRHPAGRRPAPVRRCPGPPRPGDLGNAQSGAATPR
nr:vegetative cell wall protein gp1-like [Aegilops tauschii subsp. strangulata]